MLKFVFVCQANVNAWGWFVWWSDR